MVEITNFDKLSQRSSITDGQNIGGVFALPFEFDQREFAAGFYTEAEVPAMQQEQPVQGTKYKAPGWRVWKYPDEVPTGDIDPKTKQPITTKHPKKGERHVVNTSGKESVRYVLMFRDKEVQDQVNQVYGNLGRERMDMEIEHSSSVTSGDRGMLSNERLQGVLGKEADSENHRGGAVHPVIFGDNVLQPRRHSVTR